jgi:hypothetical protein
MELPSHNMEVAVAFSSGFKALAISASFLVDLTFNRNYTPGQHFLLNKMKTGRPKLSEQDKKGQITGVRLKSEERQLLEKAASSHKKSLSDWMRNVLVSTAIRQLKKIT